MLLRPDSLRWYEDGFRRRSDSKLRLKFHPKLAIRSAPEPIFIPAQRVWSKKHSSLGGPALLTHFAPIRIYLTATFIAPGSHRSATESFGTMRKASRPQALTGRHGTR